MMACQLCESDAREYTPQCTGCVTRRIARLTPSRRTAVINTLRTGREPLRRLVEDERARLEAAGML